MANTVVFLTTTGTNSWTVPADFGTLVSIELIGGGGGACNAVGGGGGAYAKGTTQGSLVAGGSAQYHVGAGGASSTLTSGNNGADTWIRIDGNTGAPASSSQGCLAKAGKGSPSVNVVAPGGLASGCIPTTGAFDGGDSQARTAAGGMGGGGAAGLNGAGADSAGGGTGPTAGGTGDNGSGGAGGAADAGSGPGAGANGTEWDASHGSGGGGGGARVAAGVNGGAAGLYGAGGGAACPGDVLAAPAGAQGIIVITYSPLAVIGSRLGEPLFNKRRMVGY